MSENTTLTPTFIVYLNGSRFSVDHESAVKQITIIDRLDVPSSCDIIMSDQDLQWVDDADFSEGSTISVHLGFKDDIEEVFNGEITGVNFSLRKASDSTLIIKAMNTIHRLTRIKKHRNFIEMKDVDIADEIVSDNGLTLDIDEIGGEQLFTIQQNLTDHEFLLQIAKRYNCKIWANEKDVFFKKKKELSSDDIIVEWGKTLNEFNAAMDSNPIFTEVNVTGWDNEKGESFIGTIPFGDVQTVGGSDLGGKAVDDNFGAVALNITDLQIIDQAGAEDMALDIITDNAMKYVRCTGECEGNYLIKAGELMTVKEVGGRFSGEYLIHEARHQFHAMLGYVTNFGISRNSI